MKPARSIGLELLVASLPFVAEAQGVSLGVKVGANSGSISFDPQVDTSRRFGFAGGATLAFGVHDTFSIQLEALFSQKGTKVTDTADPTTVTLAVDYIEIPLLANVSVPTGSTARPIFYAGPAISFEASCSVSGELGGVTVDVSCGDPLIDGGLQRKKTDFGVVAGAGLDFDAGPAIVTIEGRYNPGLTNLDDSGDPGSSAKSRTFSLLAGVAFKLPT